MDPVQGTLDELGTPLSDVTFVVFDLETTGGAPAEDAITEIGAVKVRAGEVLGEFSTLVDPGGPIPPFISVLTGITDAMVVAAPRIDTVLPSFLEFIRGATLVAHNAGFDTRFIKAACASLGYPPPVNPVVDTVDLARRVLTRDETPNAKLSTLARFFRSSTEPCHRALQDARATVDVLHGLIERAGSFQVHTLEELKSFVRAPTPEQQRKRHLAESVPHAPGVYLFEDERGEVLYIGKSTNLRNRVRSYFTASETRPRIREMIGIAERVRHIVCATALEAEVRELRLIGGAKPRYNRRSRFPEKVVWLKLTTDLFPRLSIVRELKDDGATYLGPFGSSRLADDARIALHEAVPLRQCTQPITLRTRRTACVLHEMGRCGAPCEGGTSQEEYAVHAESARRAMTLDASLVFSAVSARMERLSVEQRYEEASIDRDRLAAFVRAAARMQRLSAITRIPQLVAASPAFGGGWDIHVIRYGRLAAAGVMPKGAHPTPFVASLTSGAESVIPGPGPVHAASAEETECILRWLESPGVRLVEVDGEWSLPARGAARHKARIDLAYQRPDRQRPQEGRPLR
ncbi:DEDD exonuclease domain-containing protein [Nonomuraea sp. KC401]|uniref:DEDD exonuclease domain-containing protein n=1 Tax=unclassified Nonomuraea TaxID=2593643 RepID=UPI0010FF569D|nr:DEDD exonuclease domain-containing protein [Nonomuraea sp. KC401]NBE95700.1 DEDD exonuclease domain-containing protein [Nonomuraea sp. K271]TLF63973.1 DEDD exonuclease domain-containing protein [Nonomuraea sp. KC401]